MAKIVLATFGSLGDMHPKIALGLELKKRGHDVIIAAMEFYRGKVEALGLRFAPMAPHLRPDDRERTREFMDAKTGPEKLIREVILPSLRPMYDDLMSAIRDAELLVTGEVVYAAASAVEKSGIKWVSTSLQPGTMFSAYDPFVPPQAPWLEYLRFIGPLFHRTLFHIMQRTLDDWLEPYRKFRRDLDLTEDQNPIFRDKFSPLRHLALFSRVLGAPQPDWPPKTVQTGFCFYDGHEEIQTIQPELAQFLNVGEPPIIFTLGSAAVMDAGNFFDESVKAAKLMNRRAVLLHGFFNEPPEGLDENIVGFKYAPYSQVFPRAACVVHQGGVGTTGQVLRAGVPHLIMPYSHDQPDNAARCRRLGVAEWIGRDDYYAGNAAAMLGKMLNDDRYASKAAATGEIVRSEHGTQKACDEIERVLNTDIK